MKTALSKTIFSLCLGLSFILSACGAGEPPATSTTVPTITPLPPTLIPTATLIPTRTPLPTRTPAPTITPDVAATEQYADFLAVVQMVYDAGHIETLDGKYIELDEYSDELAMHFGYSWSPTGVRTKSFIIRADFDWEVANKQNYSGCGYMFRQDPNDPKLYYIIALDGINGILLSFTEWTGRSSGGLNHYPAQLIKKMSLPEVGSNPYHAQFTLVVTDTAAYTYVNGNFFTEHRLTAEHLTASGALSSLVLTGSDKDYGTRCKISNAELWVIEP